MSNLAQALGKKFIENQQEVRIRSFELGGHTFKVRVPLTVEADATYARLKNIDTESEVKVSNVLAFAKKYFDDLADIVNDLNTDEKFGCFSSTFNLLKKLDAVN